MGSINPFGTSQFQIRPIRSAHVWPKCALLNKVGDYSPGSSMFCSVCHDRTAHLTLAGMCDTS